MGDRLNLGRQRVKAQSKRLPGYKKHVKPLTIMGYRLKRLNFERIHHRALSVSCGGAGPRFLLTACGKAALDLWSVYRGRLLPNQTNQGEKYE